MGLGAWGKASRTQVHILKFKLSAWNEQAVGGNPNPWQPESHARQLSAGTIPTVPVSRMLTVGFKIDCPRTYRDTLIIILK